MNPDAALDLRLARGAVAAWIVTVLLKDASVRTAVATGCTALVLGAALVVSRRSARAWALAAFAIALVLFPAAARWTHAQQSPLRQLARHNTSVQLELTVTADPRPIGSGAGPPRLAVPGKARAVLNNGAANPVYGDVLVLAPASGWLDLLPGQRVRTDGELSPSLSDRFGVTLSVQTAPRRIGRPPWWHRAAGRVRSSLQDAASGLPVEPRGLLPGLVDGDTSRLDPVLAEHFRIAGLTHLVAVSGMNCSILLGAVLLVLRRARVRPAWCAAAGVFVILAFVVVARPSPSVLRAAVMASVTVAALAAGRPREGLPALSAATIVLLACDDGLAVDPGFAMSVLATAALLILAPRWAVALRARRVPPGLAEAVAVASAAHLVTVPVVAAIGGRISLVAVPANVLAEPVVAAATILGFAAASTAPWCHPLGALFAQLAGWPCRWLVAVADYFGEVHGASIPWPGGAAAGVVLAVLIALLLLAVRKRRSRAAVVAGAIVLVFVQWPVRWIVTDWPPRAAVLVACDVGQGDALAVPVAPHSAIVVDAGPDPIAVDRCLHDLGVDDIPLLVLTHLHLDHVGGMTGALRGRDVGEVVTGPSRDPASGLHLVDGVLAQRGLSLGTVRQGQQAQIGPAHIEVLGPRAAFHDTRSDPNNSSVAMRMTVGGVRMLLAGDMEVEAQRALLDEGVEVRADILKVPHHGSAYSDRAFLAAVGASAAVISVGAHNDYGHPAPSLVRTLVGLGITARRTDLDGDVAFVAAGGGVRTVVRGTRSSTLGMRLLQPRATAPAVVSAIGVRMGPCPLARSIPTPCPIRSPASFSSSATRNCWSPGPSARSPPQHGEPTRRSSRPS